jgi:hypothetical protein
MDSKFCDQSSIGLKLCDKERSLLYMGTGMKQDPQLRLDFCSCSTIAWTGGAVAEAR